MKTVTIREVYEAAKKNGFELARDDWFSISYGGYKAACILGQASINLGVVPYAGEEYNAVIDIKTLSHTLIGELNKFRIPLESKWYMPDETRGVGTLITLWNDKGEYNENNGYQYDLPTYDDVAQMVYEVLEPFFDEEITLNEWEHTEFINQ
jgi:hypothetical protein